MEPRFEAETGAAAWQISNPPILSAAPLIASLGLFQAARIERLRAKSVALTGFLEELLQPLQASVQLITPRAVDSRGCQLSIRILGGGSRGRRVLDRLTELDVICDWREPDVIRVAPIPLYNRFEEVFRFSEHLTQVLREIA
jgi:kynureninase